MKIFDRTYNLFGTELRVRWEPREFKKLTKQVNKLVQQSEFDKASKLLNDAYKTWGHDSELIRMATLVSFLRGDD